MIDKLQKIKQPKLTRLKTRVDKETMHLAASWYVAMRSKALANKPKAIDLFGQSLVAWRDQKGHPVIMERYCSHMGASLAIGKVSESCIQCPFHHWRFDNTGHCVSIPEVDDIPPTARQTTYVTVERYGYIWVWYGSKTPLFSLPEFSAAEDERHNYMPLRHTFNIKTTVRRVVENVYDQSHVVELHNLKVASSLQLTLLNDQHLVEQNEPLIEKKAWFGGLLEARVESYVWPVGAIAQALGLKIEVFTTQIDSWPSGHILTASMNGKERFKVLTSITPVAENETIWEIFMMHKKTGNFLLDIPYYLLFGLQGIANGAQDVPIWNTMNPDAGGAYIKHDRGVLKFREFYQSWVDKVQSTEPQTSGLAPEREVRHQNGN